MVTSYMPLEVVELHATGRRTAATLPYDAMDGARGWHQRVRAVYAAPACVLRQYISLASRAFTMLYRGDEPNVEEETPIVLTGDVGLGLALDEGKQPVVSVEAAALLELVAMPGTPECLPGWLTSLQATWCSGQCLFGMNTATGWRACFAEHRLWSALLLEAGSAIKTPHCKAVVRGWYPVVILEDLKHCVGRELLQTVASTVAEYGFDGAPDVVSYRPGGVLRLVEVKSGNDALKPAQTKMLSTLARIPGVSCHVCGPASALKRVAATMLDDASDDSA